MPHSKCMLSLLTLTTLFGSESATTTVGPRLLVSGWGLGYIAVYDGQGKEEWRIEKTGNQCDSWMLSETNVLFTTGNGVREVRRDPTAKNGASLVWELPTPDSETHGCQPLADNRILICRNYKNRLEFIEFERGTLKELLKVEVTDPAITKGGAHGSARQVRKTSRGTYLIGLMDSAKDGGVEIDAKGTVVRRFPEIRYGLEEMPDGGFLGAGGDSHCIIRFDAEGKELWRIKQKDIPGFTIGLCAAIHAYPDGSILAANWGGHGGSVGPCVGLISPDHKSLQWSLKLKPEHRIVAFQVLPPVKETTKKD